MPFTARNSASSRLCAGCADVAPLSQSGPHSRYSIHHPIVVLPKIISTHGSTVQSRPYRSDDGFLLAKNRSLSPPKIWARCTPSRRLLPLVTTPERSSIAFDEVEDDPNRIASPWPDLPSDSSPAQCRNPVHVAMFCMEMMWRAWSSKDNWFIHIESMGTYTCSDWLVNAISH